MFRCFDLYLNKAGHDELLDLVKDAAEKAEGFVDKMAESVDDGSLGQSDVRAVGAQSRKTYMRELHKVCSFYVASTTMSCHVFVFTPLSVFIRSYTKLMWYWKY